MVHLQPATHFSALLTRAHARVCAAVSLAAVFLGPAHAAPPCDGINFDSIQQGTTFTAANQPYLAGQGVSFSSTCGSPEVWNVQPGGGLPNAPSPPHALASPLGDPLVDCCVRVSFATPQNWVRFQVAANLFTLNLPQAALVVTAYDGLGNPIASQPVILSHLAPPDQLQWATVVFDQGIANCEISHVDVCTNGIDLSLFFIDDLEWGNDQTDPMVQMDNPLEGDCLCDGNLVVDGSVCDDGCGEVEVELRIRPIVTGTPPPYTVIATDTPPTCLSIPGFFSTTLPAAQFPEGRYLLQMRAKDACGRSNVVDREVLIDRNPPVISVSCPVNAQIVNKQLDIVGSITDLCPKVWRVYFGPINAPAPLVASGTSNVGPVIASIDTTILADGDYKLIIYAFDQCGRASRLVRRVLIDNTPPVAFITSPDACLTTCPDDQTPVDGVIYDAHLAGWQLEYKIGSSPIWTTIMTGTNNVGIGTPVPTLPALIAAWHQCNLPNCCYILRLTAWDTAGSCPSALGTPVGPNVTVHEFCANLGLLGDVDGDGQITGADLSYILSAPVCPPCP